MNGIKRGFTLVELLVVMAITAILITLITIPLVRGLALTQAASAYKVAQDTSRLLSSRIQRELSQATIVLDNSAPSAAIEVRVPLARDPLNTGNAVMRGGELTALPAGNITSYGSVFLHNAKLDFVPPAQGDPANPQYNPGRNRIDPTLRKPLGQVTVPVAPGQTIVRYWIGLQRPYTSPNTADDTVEGVYSNPYDPRIVGGNRGDIAGVRAGSENLFVLYRAEVAPYVFRNGAYVANTDFFAVDANGQPVIDDPGFFVWNPTNVLDNLTDHRRRLINWKNAAVIQVEQQLMDLVIYEVDEGTNEVLYDLVPGSGNVYRPRIRPLFQVFPERVSNEPAEGHRTTRSGQEVLDAETSTAPTEYRTQQHGWTQDTLVRLFVNDPRTNPPYFLVRWRPEIGPEMVLFDPSGGGDEYTGGTPVFDVAAYQRARQAGPVNLGQFLQNAGANPLPLRLVRVDDRSGKILASFPARDAFGYVPQTTGSTANANLSGWLNSPLVLGTPGLADLGRRFIWLADTTAFPPGGGADTFNPLTGPARGWPIPSAKIVPGSERVWGPDMRPGPNFGQTILYSRVAQGDKVGLNQYKINYNDIAEPTDYPGMLGIPDPASNADVRQYIQPRFKKGYIEFYSDPTLDLLPNGNIFVEFDFQLNNNTDGVFVDYDSRQKMHVEVGVRRYPAASNAEPQVVTVRDVVAVRNFVR
jgi:prepilin-type N-terminal cleavage/methylation domain-containing protein